MISTSLSHFQQLERKLKTKEAKIAVIGLGYVGLPLAKGLAARGVTVHGIEEQAEKVQLLKEGHDYIEPTLQDLPDLLPKLHPTTDFATISFCDVIIICVPTPLTRNLEPDISYVEKVSHAIGAHVQPGSLIILESTTYPGTTEEVVKPAVEGGGKVKQVGEDYFLAFSPERVDPGNPTYHTSNTTKVLGGATPECSKLAGLVYETLLGSPDLVKVASSTRAAEMEKLFENIFRSVNIALVNEMAILCRSMDLDVWEIIELASTKPYGFMPFYPGPGIGGHCIPLDPFYLSWKAREFDLRTRFIELAGELNAAMPRHVISLASEVLGSKGLQGANILIVGASYKPNIADSRESPAIKIVELLKRRGGNLSLYDPLSKELRISSEEIMVSVDTPQEDAYDLTILVTVHSNMDLSALLKTAPNIVDTRGVTRGVPTSARVMVLGAS